MDGNHETPAQRAEKILRADLILQSAEDALPQIVRELARGNALTVETIKLQQLAVSLQQKLLAFSQDTARSGPEQQTKMIDAFGPLLAQLMELATARPPSPPLVTAAPTPAAPVERTGDGTRVEGDPAAATPRAEV